MKKKPNQILSMMLLAALLAACNMPARSTATPIIDQALAGTMVAMTLEALHTRAPESTLVAAPTSNGIESTVLNSPVPSTTPSPIATTAATSTITPTYSAPILVFDGNTNCREGPGTNYRVVTVLGSSQKIVPVGVQGNYWIVKNPNGPGTCWVAADFATPSGSTWTVTTMTAPAPPTVQAPPKPYWAKWESKCDYVGNSINITTFLSWGNLSTNLTGYRVYRDGEVIATLGANVTTYTDTTPWVNGKTLTYSVEAYMDSAKTSSSIINTACQ